MEILEVVKDAIKDRINIDSINYDDKLDELGLDSLDLVETMLKIEEAVGVEFNGDVAVVIACNRYAGLCVVCKGKSFKISFPFFVGVVIDVIAEVNGKLRFRQKRHGGTQRLGRMQKILCSACLNVGDRKE